MSRAQPSVAILGTGIMGGPMAKNIGAAGLDTRAWNRTREKADELGLPVAGSPAEAVDGVDIVLTMLADGSAVESVMTDGGALESMRDDAVCMQTSTVGIEATERLAKLAEERGVAYVDSPVLGTKAPAAPQSILDTISQTVGAKFEAKAGADSPEWAGHFG